jgi:predicted DNA binding CopG/RHH family protein
MKKINKEKEQYFDSIISQDSEKWEKRDLGSDPDYAVSAKEFSKKSVQTTIRLPFHLLEELKTEAKKEGLPYQTLVKSILTKYLNNKNVA